MLQTADVCIWLQGPHTHTTYTQTTYSSLVCLSNTDNHSHSQEACSMCVCVQCEQGDLSCTHRRTSHWFVNITAEVKPHCMCVYSRFPIISEPAALMVKQRTTKNSKIWLQNEVAVPLLTCFKSSDSNDRHPWCKSSEYEVISCVVFSSSPPFTYLLTFIKWLKQNELRRRLQLPLTLRGHAAGYS